MKRRAHKRGGTIYHRKDGLWAAQLNLGIVAGRRKRKTFSGATQADVIAKLNADGERQRRGLPVLLGKQTFGAFVDKWLAAVRSSLRESTFKRYSSLLAHATKALGGKSLEKLGAADLQRLYGERQRDGAAPRTVLHVHRAIHRALVDAKRWGDVAQNVAELASAPKVTRPTLRTLTADEARQLMQAAEGHRLGAIVVLALSTGMRLGELLGLTWRAIDLDAGSVRVEASLQPTSKGLALVEPKTARSRRQILIEPRVAATLRRHRAAQEMERRVAGPAWVEKDLVFSTATGGFIDGRDLLRKDFRPLLKKAGLEPIRFHDLRHSYASIALARGVHAKVVQEAMGHSTIVTTLDTYSHVVPSLQRDAAREMGAALFGA